VDKRDVYLFARAFFVRKNMKSGELNKFREDRPDNSIPQLGDFVMAVENGGVVFGHINSIEFAGSARRVYIRSGNRLLGRTKEQVNVLVTDSFFKRYER
jgi:hypothetical protein